MRLNDVIIKLKLYKNIYVYGTSPTSCHTIYWLNQNGISVDGIFVASINDNPNFVEGIEVKDIQSIKTLPASKKDSFVVFVVENIKNNKEISQILEQYNVKDTIYADNEFIEDLNKNLLNQQMLKLQQKKKNVTHNSESDILFLSPPFWDYYTPFSAVPCLKAALHKQNFSSAQIDIGIYVMHHLIKKYFKWSAKYCLSENFYNNYIKIYSNNVYSNYNDYVNDMWFFNDDCYDLDSIKQNYDQLNSVQKRVIDAFYDNIASKERSFADFDKIENLTNFVESRHSFELFETLLEDKYILDILNNLPNIVGISITSQQQFAPGCLLSKVVRLFNPKVKIIMGGSCADLFFNSNYKNKSEIKKYFDYVVIGEGEDAVIRLVDVLKQKTLRESDINNISNVWNLHENGGGISYRLEDVDELQLPDYDGLNLNLYLAPKTILPYQASRGCHWGNCAFCNHDEKYRHNYRPKPAKKVVNDLLELSKKYKVNHFQFVDEAIRPDHFREIVEEMDKHDEFKKMKWLFYSRVSNEYDSDILKKAHDNGCEMVMFGVETLNQRLLNFIRKGILAKTTKKTLKLFHDSGIKIHAWLLCNLPSETLEEAEKDLQEVKSLIEFIDVFSVGMFALYNNTDMMKEPDKFNIVSIDPNDVIRFQSHHKGKIIDKEAMIKFFQTEYRQYQLEKCGPITTSRYTRFLE